MNKYIFFLIVWILLSQINLGYSQCRAFAKQGKSGLGEFVHDGAYNALMLSSGQNAQLHKTFYSGQKYRILIAAQNTIQQVKFEVLDLNGNVLYSNTNNNYSLVWDFSVENSQTFIISLTIPKNNQAVESGCVATVFGFQSTVGLVKQYE